MSINYSGYLEYVNGRYSDEASANREEMIKGHAELMHAVFGLNGEVGELTDLIKKSIFYGKPWDQEKLLSELGDVIHYYMRVAHLLHFSLPTVMQANVDKLNTRDKADPKRYMNDDVMLARLNGLIGTKDDLLREANEKRHAGHEPG
jgi:NTP pyrophosphatase (non-canonical NTP hydrolase)